jgi:hypothetical protein
VFLSLTKLKGVRINLLKSVSELSVFLRCDFNPLLLKLLATLTMLGVEVRMPRLVKMLLLGSGFFGEDFKANSGNFFVLRL